MVASGVALAAEIRCPNSIGNRCIGTNEADTMTGTNQDDDIVGLGGADKMVARGGADTLFGGGGSDDISAGPGNDPSVNGGTGDDLLSGESGDDTYVFRVRGNWGADRIPIGGEGAGMGTDELGFALLTDSLDIELVSSPDRDEVASDAGMLNFPPVVEIEDVSGGTARDVIRGNDSPNRLSGKGGNDELVGRGGDDALSGGQGADALDGGEGIDELNGGIGNDAYLFQNGWGEDSITDDAMSGGTDRLFFGGLTSPVKIDLTASDGVEVSSGADPTLNTVGWPAESEIENATGGTDNDDLRGNQSDNTLNGQGGDDTISGGGGNDTISGGDGEDTIDVADGDLLIGDTVDCGPGTDTVDADAVDEVNRSSCETVN